jgi:hypothetical protein
MKEKDSATNDNKRREEEVRTHQELSLNYFEDFNTALMTVYILFAQMKRRQTASRAQLDRWREAESSSQLNLKKAAEEAARLARRGSMVDPGKMKYEI